ncbi:hypothetical protein ACXR2W_07420 [Leucobacter sp. HY1908]
MMFDSATHGSAGYPLGDPIDDPAELAPVVGAATDDDLTELREWLGALDASAYGQVFIEANANATATAAGREMLVAPKGIGITWLRPGERPGAALTAAVDAWFAEWLWVEAAGSRAVQVFTAAYAETAIAPFLRRFECRLEKRWPGCSRDACPRLRAD